MIYRNIHDITNLIIKWNFCDKKSVMTIYHGDVFVHVKKMHICLHDSYQKQPGLTILLKLDRNFIYTSGKKVLVPQLYPVRIYESPKWMAYM